MTKASEICEQMALGRFAVALAEYRAALDAATLPVMPKGAAKRVVDAEQAILTACDEDGEMVVALALDRPVELAARGAPPEPGARPPQETTDG